MKTKSKRKKRERVLDLIERIIEGDNIVESLTSFQTLPIAKRLREADVKELEQLTAELNNPAVAGIKTPKRRR